LSRPVLRGGHGRVKQAEALEAASDKLAAEKACLRPHFFFQMVFGVLRTQHVAEHAIGFAHRLYHKFLHSLAELFVSLDTDEAAIHNFTVVISPVVASFILLPVPATHALAVQALENEHLAALLVLDEHANVVVLRARDAPDDAVLHCLAREEQDVSSLRILHQLLARDATHLPEVARG